MRWNMGSKRKEIVVDLLVAPETGTYHHVMRWTYGSGGVYAVPQTMTTGVDSHVSYHTDGRRHGKLTRGRMTRYPPGAILGIGIPKLRPKVEYQEWREDGPPFASIRGVVRFLPKPCGVTNVLALTQGYPVVRLEKLSESEHVIIQPNALGSPMVSIEAWLVESGLDALAVEHVAVASMERYWHPSPCRVQFESCHLFTSRSPSLAITIASRQSQA